MTQPAEGAQSGTTDAQSGVGENGSGTDGSANGSTSTSGTGAQSGTDANGKTYSEQEFTSVQERMRAADQRASKLEQELKAIRDKDLPEAEKLKRDHEEALSKLEKANARVAEMAMSNAFLTDNTYKWKNPATAMKLLDRSKVTVEEDGTVQGMKDALKALATSDPYLLDDTKGDEEKETTPPGTAPGNNGGAGKGKDPKAVQVRRFPAMRTRV